MPLLRLYRRSAWYAVLALGLSTFSGACQIYQAKIAPVPEVRVDLVRYGLARDYARHDADDCTDYVIGYRSVVWLSSDRLAVVFNTSPNCRPSSGQRVTNGSARLLVFDPKGNLHAKRDVSYDADGGEELIASGDALHGPGQTLLFRVEEAGNSKSGVRLFDAKLNDVVRIDRFMETPSVIDSSLVFQEGRVWSGPRTYDVYDGGLPSLQMHKITQNWPTGTMSRIVGSRGVAYMLCQQALGPNNYQSTNVIYANAHRRCWMKVQSADGRAWDAQLKQDQVAELLGIQRDGTVVGIVRQTDDPDELVIWRQNQTPEILPWFPIGYGTELLGIAGPMDRYLGVGERNCRADASCTEDGNARLMIFDRSSRIPLVDRQFPASARAALSPDGLHYAMFENGELRISALPSRMR